MAKIDKSPDMIDYIVVPISGHSLRFKGKYRRDLETKNWHYWEKNNGVVLHFRKEHIFCIEGGTVQTVKDSRFEKGEL